ncbi:MAG: multicopper oxidase domain-containing protein [Parcubacteria group bacterium]|nr:multicopper oxidase domain-containing protein [Parcubacteria group bacterium]
MQPDKSKSILISSIFGLLAVIVFGLLWFFFLAPAVPAGIGWFIFSFAAGLTMIVLPCTLPLAFVIVPLSMGKGVAKGIGTAIAFAFGIVITLSIYGIIASLIGKAALGSLGAPLETVKNWVYFIAGIFAYLFALGSIGLLSFKMPTYTGAAPDIIQKKEDYLKAFLMGLFLGNIGIGCPHPATPLLLIEAATSGNVLYGWLLFFVHAVGRVLPLLFLAFMGIMGVNGLSWLIARKDKVEKATGWAMVFVGAFILVLGLFSHDWWVNSGQHSLLEAVTQEERFLDVIGENLGTGNAHHHGIETGTGLFGLPLWLGSWVLVILWVLPFFWYLQKEKARIAQIPETNQIPERLAEDNVRFMRKKFYIALAIALGAIFIYILPMRFYNQSIGVPAHNDNASVPSAAVFSQDIIGLPEAKPSEVVELKNGDTYTLSPGAVWKEINGKRVKMLAYNGMIPGPTIKAKQGSEVTIHFVNNLEIKDTLHSHGVRLDNAFDGVAGVTQEAVLPGGSFDYKIKFPDSGIYWYHSHMNEAYTQGLGMYGAFLVEPKEGKFSGREEVVFLSDLLMNESGIVPFPKDFTDHAMMGRFGNTMLVNGSTNYRFAAAPGETVRFHFVDSAVARTFRLSVLEKLGGEKVAMTQVGSDGGELEHKAAADEILVSPGERATVDIRFPEMTGEYQEYNLYHESSERTYLLATFEVRGNVSKMQKEIKKEFNLKEITYQDKPIFSKEELNRYRIAPPDKRIKLSLVADMNAMMKGMGDGMVMPTNAEPAHDNSDGHHGSAGLISEAYASAGHGEATEAPTPAGMPAMDMSNMNMGGTPKKIEWEDDMGAMNAMSNSNSVKWEIIDEDNGRVNGDINWTFSKGDMVKVRIWNDPKSMHPMQHPIHFHGQRFVVLATNGVLNDNLAWKDTTLVQTGDTVDILVEMSNPGIWMAHCHIAEHLHSGMMFGFVVRDGRIAVGEQEDYKIVLPQERSQMAAASAWAHGGEEDTHEEPAHKVASDGHTDHEHAPMEGGQVSVKFVLILVSLLLMGGLSYGVWRYLDVKK